MLHSLARFLEMSPDGYHAVAAAAAQLREAGFQSLEAGSIEPGGQYYCTQGGAALLAFRVPADRPTGFVLTGSHGDSPCFRLRGSAEISGTYTRLSAERYGGLLPGGWLDRPLGVAGRVLVRTEGGIEARLIDLGPETVLIPSVAIHLNREAGSGGKFDFARDFTPLYGGGSAKGSFPKAVAAAAGCAEADVLATDLSVYNGQKAVIWGPQGEFFSGPRLDDLACVFACTQGFLMAGPSPAIQVLGISDNEEIGSETSRGAAAAFLPETLRAVSRGLGFDEDGHQRLPRNSFLLSCDNGHGIHPNHPELADGQEAPVLGGGVVVKHSRRYATDGMAAAVFTELCRRASVPVQHYSNRPDQAGGSTLGNIAAARTPILTVDIGMAQLAMHSCFETLGGADVEYFVRAVRAAYETPLTVTDTQVLL